MSHPNPNASKLHRYVDTLRTSYTRTHDTLSELVAVECKSRLSRDDVDDFVSRLQRFKVAFPQFREFRVYGAVAAIEIDQGIDVYAYRRGLFVIKQSGETVFPVSSVVVKFGAIVPTVKAITPIPLQKLIYLDHKG